jgi:hypothetical protein
VRDEGFLRVAIGLDGEVRFELIALDPELRAPPLERSSVALASG